VWLPNTPPGTICQTNKECDANCLGGQWSVALKNNNAVLLCDPKKTDRIQYYAAACEKMNPDGRELFLSGSRGTVDKDLTKNVCKDQGGQICDDGCVVSGVASREEDLRTRWDKACRVDGTTLAAVVKEDSELGARDLVSCSP
jgi:hypothetical protein